MTGFELSRRRFVSEMAALGLMASLPARARAFERAAVKIPPIGMGSWLTFDVGANATSRANCVEVLRIFFELGGGLIDSSPMYRTSEEVIGHCLDSIDDKAGLFAATKVWKYGREPGVSTMEASRRLWGVEHFDLMQIHNMLDWQTHLDTLRQMKADGQIRYIGITTSHGRRHAEFERVITREDDFDFVQFTYNMTHRTAEERLLPLALERGKGVIINRPLDGGRLFDTVVGRPLPGWASEIACDNWAQVFLKFIVSHPAVSCAIPATSRVDHMRQNMGALHGPVPDAKLRQRMLADYLKG